MAAKKSVPSAYIINLEPVGSRVAVQAGTTLLQAAQQAGVELISICGGTGTCGSCRVQLVSGKLSSLTLDEQQELDAHEISAGFRLACQAVPQSDVCLTIPPDSLTTPQRLQLEGVQVDGGLAPAVIPLDLVLTPPDLLDLRPDATRVRDALLARGYSFTRLRPIVLRELSEKLRARKWNVKVAIRQNEVVAVLPTDWKLLGLAVDIGTTKLAAYLVNLENGAIVAKTGEMNPQIAYGEDVISRIAYTIEHPNGRRVLQEKLVGTLNLMIKELCQEANASPEQIVEATVVGNTAMHHLFAGLPVHQLGLAPYVPATGDPLEIPAHDIGLEIAPAAMIYLPPNIAGYVGADHVAMLLAIGIRQAKFPLVALDIGTNTEITLAAGSNNGNRLLSCSCASGPAFEGAHIQGGMRAASGAIERLKLIDGSLHWYTIHNQPPVGICGSGILDAVAELVGGGAIDERGVLQADYPGMRQRNGKCEYLLASSQATGHGRDLYLGREDIKEIQLAKGAIRAGIDVLLFEAGLEAEQIQEVVVAGAFGTYLDVSSAMRIGMFPKLPKDRFRQVGNAAGMGAKQLLVSTLQRQEAEAIAAQVEYIELTTHPEFSNKFIGALVFKP